jgi:hypothetical protein
MDTSIGKDTRSNVVTQQLRKADEIDLDRNRSHRFVIDSQSAFGPRLICSIL